MTKCRKCLVFTYFSHVYSSMPMNVFEFFPVILISREIIPYLRYQPFFCRLTFIKECCEVLSAVIH